MTAERMAGAASVALVAELEDLRRRVHDLGRRIRDGARRAALPARRFQTLACRVQRDWIALLLEAVEEVVPMAQLSSLPEAPPWVAGVLHLAGDSLPVLDVAARLANRPRVVTVDDLIVVCSVEDRRVGLVVQEVEQVFPAAAGDVRAAADDLPHAGYVLGLLHHEDRPHLLLDIERLIDAELEVVA